MRIYDEKSGIYYEIKDEAALVCDSDKGIPEAEIPAEYNGKPVTGIMKKAFLSCRQLRYVKLPDTVRTVGQWAFSSCDALRVFECHKTEISFEPGAFKGDRKLEAIKVSGESEKTAHLLAAHVVMEADYLLDIMAAGTSEWLEKWDSKLISILNLKDDDGYHLYVLCGEEDLHYDYDQYLEYMRKKKSGLCMLRLLNDAELGDDLRNRMSEYLRSHTKGCGSEAAWRCLLENHGDDTEYYELMINLGCINRGNLEAVLSDLSDRHAEAKSYLLNAFSEDKDDFFDGMFL
ncbi:MAG: leucine-rich repeat domain-containing protein [Lachnospiraceae bacterium]|nr:leucine-rich repeat domain-containing protein [Lachnospiraceae bacterium]